MANSIQDGYEAPAGYKSAEQRGKRKKAAVARAEKVAAKTRSEE